MNDSTQILILYSKYAEQCYTKFLLGEKSFTEAAKKVMENNSSRANLKDFMFDILSVTLSSLLKMAFVYQSEMFKNNGLNEALPEEKNLLSDIKAKIASQNKTINNTMLYKLIRDAIVHSDTEHPNCKVTNIDEFTLTLKPKGQKEINIKLSNTDMMKIIAVFNLNIENAIYYTEIKEADLQNAIDSNTLNIENLENYISVWQYQKPVKFDEHQKEALLNYFYSNNEILKSRYNLGSGYGEVLMSRIPFPFNAYNLYTDYMKVVYYFMMLSRNVNSDILDIETKFYNFYKENNAPLREFLTINPQIDISNNILLAAFANLATTVNKSEFAKIMSHAGYNIDEDTANHLRNSLAHGRYFINPKKDISVEFYDGRNLEDLSWFHSLSIRDINKILVDEIFEYNKVIDNEMNSLNQK